MPRSRAREDDAASLAPVCGFARESRERVHGSVVDTRALEIFEARRGELLNALFDRILGTAVADELR